MRIQHKVIGGTLTSHSWARFRENHEGTTTSSSSSIVGQDDHSRPVNADGYAVSSLLFYL